MADDSSTPTDSLTNDTHGKAAGATSASGGGGSSVLKLAGIGVGAIAIAAIVLGGVFWKTLQDSQSRENKLNTAGAQSASANDSGSSNQGPAAMGRDLGPSSGHSLGPTSSPDATPDSDEQSSEARPEVGTDGDGESTEQPAGESSGG
ncbi:hypothetical protein [Stieleria varia]|uniref:Uncharacterized protein n=1 Tax=Stieleria varia TaxID=2528005 RepID=A0A5C6B7G9_9BACT|nr:hypothetical protein [Stieleria varia]TWU07542.1 hypothetical protein Pla52n_01150 [Stieleria varia]